MGFRRRLGKVWRAFEKCQQPMMMVGERWAMHSERQTQLRAQVVDAPVLEGPDPEFASAA